MDPKRHHGTNKTNHEAIKPIKRPRKTTYFMPVNRLTNSKSNISPSQPTKEKQPVVKPLDPSTFINGAIRPISEITPPSQSKPPVVLPESSDDSYDGIRWRESPKHVRIAPDIDKLPSSPLKNITYPSTQADKEKDEVNQFMNTVLSKYGGDVKILSSTPRRITKTKSELTFKTGRNSSLKRSNSLGVDKLHDSISLKKSLSSWMDKFENKSTSNGSTSSISSKDKESNSDDPFSDDDEELLALLHKVSQQSKPAPESDDPFTDDDSIYNVSQTKPVSAANDKQDTYETNTAELVKVLDVDFSDSFNDEEATQQKPKQPIEYPDDSFSDDTVEDNLLPNDQNKIPTQYSNDSFSDDDPAPLKENKLTTPGTESDDPFSDDDSELMAIIQNKHKSPSKSQFTKSFQEGIKKIESLQEKRAYQKEDVNITKLIYNRASLRRYAITKIIPQTYGNDQRQLILEVKDGDQLSTRLIIRGEYCELELQENDIIHIIITNEANPRLIDNKNNLLIWNPDILLSATTISQQINCPRKSILPARYKFPGESTVPLIVGEITHQIFQECIVSENWTRKYMNELIKTCLEDYLLSIFSIDLDTDAVRTELEKHIPYLETWFNKYYKQPLSPKNYIDDGNKRERVMFSVEEALDIEENIWSPMFGMKGKVDVTVTSKLLNNNVSGKFLLPIELKTGREYVTHQGQASLYALLFKDRYDMDIFSYLLMYTKEQLTKKCDIGTSDLRALINLRNRISQYFKDNVKLPPLVKNSECDRCDVQGACMTINHFTENGTKEESGIDPERYDEITHGILNNKTYKTFFNHWDNLLAQEEKVMNRSVKHLWTMTSKDRESTGNCLGNLIIIESDDTSPSQQEFVYKFSRAELTGSSFAASQFNLSDRVIISDEIGHFAISTGYVRAVTSDAILIRTRRRIITSDIKLHNFNEVNNQVFKSVLRSSQNLDYGTSKRFRIDKDSMFYGLGLARFNVLNLFLPGGDIKSRRLVVDLEKPSYLQSSSWVMSNKEKFNSDQLQAFDKVFKTKDYMLILGMPGTGKTTVIASLISFLAQQGKTILLASYTNSAVDNILLKLKDFGVNFLRIGHVSRVHPKLHEYVPERITSQEQFIKTYMEPPVVATTCLGINDITFNFRSKFDYCIVDEASQVSLPINLGPLRFSDKFILVGDHFQLPPLVQHRDPKIVQGLSHSLFKLLAETHPESVCELTYQYRMCEDIMSLSNVLVYNNRLKCGSTAVANQSLTIPNANAIDEFTSGSVNQRWMDNIFNPKNKVLFLDHDQLDAGESVVGETVQNSAEAKLINQIVEALVLAGVDQDQIGVMSFYKAQLRLLKRLLSSKTEVEILTADQYQGRDKECIIISLVRSNQENRAGDLVKEWRRLNVALTRAKSKLIILGSRAALLNTETTKTFMDFLDSKGWYYTLPPGAQTTYNLQATPFSTPTKKQRRSQVSITSILHKNPTLKNVVDDITK